MARDLNREVQAQLDRRLYRAVCKGVSGLTDHSMTITFEKDGETLDLELHADDGLAPILRERRL